MKREHAEAWAYTMTKNGIPTVAREFSETEDGWAVVVNAGTSNGWPMTTTLECESFAVGAAVERRKNEAHGAAFGKLLGMIRCGALCAALNGGLRPELDGLVRAALVMAPDERDAIKEASGLDELPEV